MESLLLPIALAGAFYFILLRPMLNQQKKRKETLSSLKIGDEVLTNAGFFAVVTDIDTPSDGPMRLHLELTEDVVVEATSDSVSAIVTEKDDENSEDDDDENSEDDDENSEEEEEQD